MHFNCIQSSHQLLTQGMFSFKQLSPLHLWQWLAGEAKEVKSREMERYYAGIDVGATNLKIGVVTDDGKVLDKLYVPLPKDAITALCEVEPQECAFMIKDALKQLLLKVLRCCMLLLIYLDVQFIFASDDICLEQHPLESNPADWNRMSGTNFQGWDCYGSSQF